MLSDRQEQFNGWIKTDHHESVKQNPGRKIKQYKTFYRQRWYRL